jgi:phosphoribosyl-dephospho-CoA transferase
VPESAQLSKASRPKIGRHTLVWIRPECRALAAAQVTDDAMHTQVTAWLAADRPLVVARQPCGEALSDTISVGLALPPAQGKRRIALSVAAHDIVRYTPPLRLSDAIAHAPAKWQPALAELNAAATNIYIELRVFGSLAWQALSGLSYLTPQSDIDLLWHPLSNMQLQQGIALLARWEQASGLRADGEVLFGGSSAVSWREWATLRSGADQRVLVKRVSSAGLVDARELLELLA